jgi:hypothetical protein
MVVLQDAGIGSVLLATVEHDDVRLAVVWVGLEEVQPLQIVLVM